MIDSITSGSKRIARVLASRRLRTLVRRFKTRLCWWSRNKALFDLQGTRLSNSEVILRLRSSFWTDGTEMVMLNLFLMWLIRCLRYDEGLSSRFIKVDALISSDIFDLEPSWSSWSITVSLSSSANNPLHLMIGDCKCFGHLNLGLAFFKDLLLDEVLEVMADQLMRLLRLAILGLGFLLGFLWFSWDCWMPGIEAGLKVTCGEPLGCLLSVLWSCSDTFGLDCCSA